MEEQIVVAVVEPTPVPEVPQPKKEEPVKVKRLEGKRITGARNSNGTRYVLYRLEDGKIYKHELKKDEPVKDTIKI